MVSKHRLTSLRHRQEQFEHRLTTELSNADPDLEAMRFFEAVFVLLTQIHDRLHVDFVVRGQHGRILLRFYQTLSDGGAQTSHRNAFFNAITLRDGGNRSLSFWRWCCCSFWRLCRA